MARELLFLNEHAEHMNVHLLPGDRCHHFPIFQSLLGFSAIRAKTTKAPEAGCPTCAMQFKSSSARNSVVPRPIFGFGRIRLQSRSARSGKTRFSKASASRYFSYRSSRPRALRSHHCGLEFQSFLAREAELGRADLVFPILYIPVPALEDEKLWRDDPVLSVVGTRQYLDWRELRHHDPNSTEVRQRLERFCRGITNTLHKPWVSPDERKRREAEELRQREVEEGRRKAAEAEAERLAREARECEQAEAARRAEEAERARLAEQEARERAAEDRRRLKAAAEKQALEERAFKAAKVRQQQRRDRGLSRRPP